MSKKLDSDNHLSLTRILALRGEGHAEIRHRAAEIVSLSSAISDVDVALVASTERNLDEWQSLVTAAGRLAALLSVGGTR